MPSLLPWLSSPASVLKAAKYQPRRLFTNGSLRVRHDSRSTLATSQIPIEQWHDVINDPTLADDILVRLMHNTHRIEFKGTLLLKKMSRLDSK